MMRHDFSPSSTFCAMHLPRALGWMHIHELRSHLGSSVRNFPSTCIVVLGDSCRSVVPSERMECGPDIDKETCEAKGCCHDDEDFGPSTIRCFYSKGIVNQIFCKTGPYI